MTVVRHAENGFLVSRAPGFFAERLDALLNDPVLYHQFQGVARSSVERFGWSKVAEKVHRLYEEVTSGEMSLIAQ